MTANSVKQTIIATDCNIFDQSWAPMSYDELRRMADSRSAA